MTDMTNINRKNMKRNYLKHNRDVINNVINALFEEHLVDPLTFINDRQYAIAAISTYIQAANIAREMMHMEPLVLYDVDS